MKMCRMPLLQVVWLFLLPLYYSVAVALVTDPQGSTKSLWQASKEKKRFVIDEYRSAKIAPEAENLSGQELIDYINSHQTLWKAGINKFNSYSDTVKYGLLGVNYIKQSVEDEKNLSPTRHSTVFIPESFDARKHWPECASLRNIRDQSSCEKSSSGSCWAVAAVEAMSDRICIMSKGTKQVTLSAVDLLSCCKTCGFGCFGGEPMAAWKYWVLNGIVTGSEYTNHSGCRPYQFPPCEHHNNKTHYEPCKHDLYPTPKCVKKCDKNYGKSYKADKYYGKQAYKVESVVESIQKEIMMFGPVEASFEVYTDFLHYTGGIYKHVAGSVGGGHAVKVFGWGIDQGVPYWLAANSWNTDWGEDGYFRILRGVDECGIESGIIAGIPRQLPKLKLRGTNEFLVERETSGKCLGAGAKENKGGNAAAVPGGDAVKAPAQGGIAGTFDPNYQTMAGLGNDVFGGDKGGAGGGGGASPATPAANAPMAPAQGGVAGTYDPNYQTMAGLGNDVFGDKGGGGGGGGGVPPGGAGGEAPKAPEQGGIAGTYDPNYQTLAGVGNDVFDKK